MAKQIRISFDFPQEDILVKVYAAVERGCDATVIETQARLFDMLSHYGTGKVYKNKGKFHRASAKGQPPAAQTGMLRLSWTTGMRTQRKRQSKVVGRIMSQGTSFGSALKYAMALEYGYEKGKRTLHPRPYIAPTIKKMKKDKVALRLISGAIKRALPQINVMVK